MQREAIQLNDTHQIAAGTGSSFLNLALTKSGRDSADKRLTSVAGSNQPIACIYKISGGPHSAEWFWTVLIGPDGKPYNGGGGHSKTGREAQEAYEDRVPVSKRG